ncbi:MAG: DNA-directed RNA polymerase subunit alpha [Gammaproteobacteria bacterium]|nr:DNA-directed RNA polymerase subunit alpha [Gammaproteobacteria bacterium]
MTDSAEAGQGSPVALQQVGSLLTPAKMVVEPIDGMDPKLALKVVLEPFERGMGHTVGNALRRIILGFMPGAAITEVKIDGVEQPYSNIEGVHEDVVDILLNLKGVCVRLNGTQPTAVLRLNAKGLAKKEIKVTADDFQDNASIEIANPDHLICTLNEKGEIYLEATVTKGRGYVPASDKADDYETVTTGHLMLDASYSPIQRVIYQVESTRVEQRTDLDKLILEVETNGTIDAHEIITRAASILQQQLGAFVDEDLLPSAATTVSDSANEEVPKEFFFQIDDLTLSVRAMNALRSEGIETIGDLVIRKESDLLKTPNLGRKSLQEIKDALLVMGLQIGMEVPSYLSNQQN